jgi:hypothetical protein
MERAASQQQDAAMANSTLPYRECDACQCVFSVLLLA